MSFSQLLVVFIIILLVFEPKKVPKIAQAIGRTIREIRNATNSLTEDIKTMINHPPISAQPAPKVEMPTPPTTSDAQPVNTATPEQHEE